MVLQDLSMIDDNISKLMNDCMNSLLTILSSLYKISTTAFSLNKDSSPRPDGFGASFFQSYWDIINHDVNEAVLQFFSTGWILLSYKFNTIVLIPKNKNAYFLNEFQPIALANFMFKIITKIITDKLASLMLHLISWEQCGFIRGRNIKDCICLTSEAINLLDSKSLCKNFALKVDIIKEFDTLSWSFLLKVLEQFGFNLFFCQ